jgi:hypothetical protein
VQKKQKSKRKWKLFPQCGKNECALQDGLRTYHPVRLMDYFWDIGTGTADRTVCLGMCCAWAWGDYRQQKGHKFVDVFGLCSAKPEFFRVICVICG